MNLKKTIKRKIKRYKAKRRKKKAREKEVEEAYEKAYHKGRVAGVTKVGYRAGREAVKKKKRGIGDLLSGFGDYSANVAKNLGEFMGEPASTKKRRKKRKR